MSAPAPPDPFDRLAHLLRGADGRILRWSAGAARLYGWPAAEAIGQHAAALLDTAPSEPEAAIRAALAREGVWRGMARQRAADGSRLDIAATWVAAPDPRGGAVGAVLEVATDLGAATEAQAALYRLAAIIEASDDAIVGEDLDGRITSWNASAERIFGHSAKQILGRPVAALVPPERAEEASAIAARVRAGGRVEPFETVRLRADGGRIPVMLSVAPIRDGEGRITGASCIAHDITNRREAEAKLRANQAELVHVSRLSELGQIASALAHEINQPLAAIANYAAGAQRLLGAGNAQGTAAALGRIGEQAQRGADIVQRLRDFMRKRETEKRPERLAAVIEEACALALIGTAAREVRLTRTVAPDAAGAVIDRVQIEQVLFNLIRNALEAMAGLPRQELSVATSRVGPDLVEVAVADSGPGLAEAVRARLFQPFVTTKSAGLGVGLSICRAIVQAHGGELTAEDAPGGGTVFRFTLAAPGEGGEH
ncbi:MAG: PAS domain S-box protein [Rhodospirillales bacterium]|nr:PAS domain S-box protein [Rhodospirillales bacterium]